MPDPQNPEGREADQMGEKPDLGREPDHLTDALTGTDVGSDTRAGSLRGGSASGSDVDPDQDAVNASLADQGGRGPEAQPRRADPDPVKNTGHGGAGPTDDPAGGPRGADAATG
ncbi:MAG: ribonuclease [Alphaproteobacteria bacterium]|nr:ribonuclease [Alphaproteobacteria bacterium]MBU1526662.1 ribonuclease [Alphaproteobacteria bacterium]MBU2350170.1 ribonuclease [Alphaproteobacteria bacterium]MBU2382126.1 ribonuclease [Alphaproteobacteria bacterium]